jgi:hypothetical protein
MHPFSSPPTSESLYSPSATTLSDEIVMNLHISVVIYPELIHLLQMGSDCRGTEYYAIGSAKLSLTPFVDLQLGPMLLTAHSCTG